MNRGAIKAGSLLANAVQLLSFQGRTLHHGIACQSIGYTSHGQYHKYSFKTSFIVSEVRHGIRTQSLCVFFQGKQVWQP